MNSSTRDAKRWPLIDVGTPCSKPIVISSAAIAASAVLAVTGIEPIIYPPGDTAGLVARLRKRAGDQVLVVGHSNTIPPLLQQLGVVEPVTIDELQYGDLWVVTLPTEGPAKLEVRRYGEQPPRPDSPR